MRRVFLTPLFAHEGWLMYYERLVQRQALREFRTLSMRPPRSRSSVDGVLPLFRPFREHYRALRASDRPRL